MVSLIAKSALDGLVPLTEGNVTLTDWDPGTVTSLSPMRGQEAKVEAALRSAGLGWPGPNATVASGDRAILRTGVGQAFLIGSLPLRLEGLAAMTDQTDGWAALELDGPGATDVLARLVAVDLRMAAFAPGQVLRTGLTHMMSILWRTGPATFRILVFRSMAQTAVHEIHVAMKSVAARAGH
ncbi:MAG: sarcosine oxidase subunit gamma [Rhodobacteraceae bacterium]|nr:sarcosine oxidase subunit gamma [Paracoccaceae bacterium]